MDDDRHDHHGHDAPAPPGVRPGAISLTIGLALLTGAVAWRAASSGPAALGVWLGYLAVWALGIAAIVTGIARLRSRAYEVVPAPTLPPVGRRSRTCAIAGHRAVHLSRSGETPSHWECRRCGATSATPFGGFGGGRAWICELPLVEHRYDRVGGSATAPARWRCRRCGRVRFSPPRSAAETLDASHVEQLFIRRSNEL